jgi:hypothetical protein
MHGHGVMQTSDGWEYTGQWKEDELHGDVVVNYVFGFNAEKQLHIYENGVKVSERAYDTSKDWAQIESLGLEAARDGENKAIEARNEVSHPIEFLSKECTQRLVICVRPFRSLGAGADCAQPSR